MDICTTEPQSLLLRYPAVSAAERTKLIEWLRSLDARTLVRLLADGRTESKLLAIRSREPELQHLGYPLQAWLVALLIVLVVAAAVLS